MVLDDEDRENEGDLIMAADAATPEAIAFFVRHTSGVICAALSGDRCEALALPLMVPPATNADQFRTAFTVTVDAAVGTTTGISAADRAATLRALADPSTRPAQLNRPGPISSRCEHGPAASCNALATRRPPSTSPASPAAPPQECSANWCSTTGPWPACPNCRRSRERIACR